MKLGGGLRATKVNSQFYTVEIKILYLHIIILKFIMRINETFNLVYAKAGLRVDDFWFSKMKNDVGQYSLY